MNDKAKNEKNAAICQLLEQLQTKVYKLKLLFDDIKLNTEDRITLETEFRKECFGVTSTTWDILEKIGNWSRCSCVPPEQLPEQLGKPAYQPDEIEGDVSSLTDYVKFNLDSINKKRVEDDSGYNEPDITKEQWLKGIESIVDNLNSKLESYNKKTTSEDSTYRLDILNKKIIFDVDIINAAKGFMLGPVGLFRGKVIEAATLAFENIHEMRIFLTNLQSKTKDMVLYMTYEYLRPDFGNADPFKMTLEERENVPKVKVYCWRGAFVDKE
jgi:hypothetical protein